MPVAEEGQEYGHYSPDQFREQPPPDSATTGLVDESGASLPSFSDEVRQDFEGLLFLGALTKSFTWLGHRFIIRTLSQGELLIVPLIIKQWSGTVGEAKAYTTAVAALSVVSVDGQSLPTPIGEGSDEFGWANERLGYVLRNWFQYTIDRVYSEYLELETKAEAVIAAMEKASGPTELTRGSNVTAAGPSDSDS